MTRTALYRHFDAAGALLYVGITDDLTSRNKAHAKGSAWHDEVARTDTQWCVNRYHAIELERVAIRFEGPRHNVMSVPQEAVQAPRREARISDFSDIFRIWPTMSELAVDLGCAYTTVASWKQRGRIPADHDEQVICAAARRGFDLTRNQLAKARQPRRCAVKDGAAQ